MTCKSCGKHMVLAADMCVQCEKEVARIEELRRHYSRQKLNGYDLRYVIIDLRREKFSLKNIAYITDKDINLITNAWDLILQDGQ